MGLVTNHNKSDSLRVFTPDQPVQILAMDGGGLMGLYSASVIKSIEDNLGHSLTKHFDIICGTSTGGLIALGLGLGKSAEDIQNFYITEGPKIFPNRGLERYYRFFRNLLIAKYSNAHLEKTLRKLLVLDDQEETPLLLHSKKRLILPTYLAANSQPRLLKTPHDPRLRKDWKMPMWAAAMATSAAPTYLPSFHFEGTRYLDGGLWANNPSLVGVVEALELGASLQNIRVLNISTTSSHSNCLHFKPLPFVPLKYEYGKLGKLPWAAKVLSVVMNANSHATSHMFLRQLLAPGNLAVIDRQVAPEHALDSIDFEEFQTIGEEDGMHSCGGLSQFFKYTASPYEPDPTAIGKND
jgi:hypothetical protein